MTRRTEAFAKARTQARTLLSDHPKLEAAVADLDYCATDGRFRRAVQRLQDARAGLPGAAAYDGSIGGSGDGESKVERLAITGDRTDWDREMFDQQLRLLLAALTMRDAAKACKAAHRLRVFIDVWGLRGRDASAKERAEVERANQPADECALTREHLGCHVRPYRTSNLGGLLPEALPVSRWLHDTARSSGRLPTSQEWRKHGSTDDDLRSQLIAGNRPGRAKVSA